MSDILQNEYISRAMVTFADFLLGCFSTDTFNLLFDNNEYHLTDFRISAFSFVIL